MSSGFDYSEFVKFAENMKDFSDKFEGWLMAFALNEGMRLIGEMQLRTPVDTGALRGAWMPGQIERKGEDLIIHFYNSMEYATFVEYGHAKPYKSGATPGSVDWVEGYFMMEVSIDKIMKSMPRRFEKSFIKLLKDLEVQ